MPDYSISPEDMIRPLQSGQQLLDDISSTQLEAQQCAIWWLGQSGYAVKTKSELFYIDLYLSEHLSHKYQDTAKPHVRITHAPVRGADLRNVRWLFSSHKHSDHLDPGSLPDLFQHNLQMKLVLPAATAAHAASMGLDPQRFITTQGDESLQLGNMTVHSIPSAHADFDYEPEHGYPYVGYMIELDGLRFYHSGDTVIYEGLAERLAAFKPDIAFLPINGTDAIRHELQVPPNMSIADALELAAQIGRPVVIPHHYDMFTFNTVNVADFISAAEAANQPYQVLQCGEKFIYARH